MTVRLDALLDHSLDAAPSDETYRLHRAAVEWRLASPIAIRSAADILSSAGWKDLVKPYHHQVQNLITFCRIAPAALLADEVGLGKTVSAGLILSELKARGRVRRALVLCPKVLCDLWVEELGSKFRIKAQEVSGQELTACDRLDSEVVVASYETARRHLGGSPTGEFQMLILDEAHRLRNLHGGRNPPQVATELRAAIESGVFTYLLMLTATPVQNRFWDIDSLIDLLTLAKGHTNPFGTPEQFRDAYLVNNAGRRLRPEKLRDFREVLRGYVARTRRSDANLPFPAREVRLEKVPLAPGERELEAMIGHVVGHLNPLIQTSLGQALMSSPVALAAQLENMAPGLPHLAGYLSRVAVHARSLVERGASPAKLTRLYTLCDWLQKSRPDWRLVVFTSRKETQEMIRQGLQARGVPVGLIAGGRHDANRRDTDMFVSDPPRLRVLVSTEAGAEGMNLQAANVLVNYDLPWNPMRLEQRIGRLQRLGSKHQKVVVLNLVAAGTIEEAVVGRLMEKLLTVTDTVGDIESVLAGVVNGLEDGSEERFEARVRDLVVQSLMGQDKARSAELEAENINRALEVYKDSAGQMDRDLGSLDAIHTGQPPPRFERPQPSIPADQFALRAWAAVGRPLREVGPGLYVEAGPGQPARRLALDAAAVGQASNGPPVQLCVPGQPAFDRLAERWAEQRCHRVLDLRQVTQAGAERLAREWCASYQGVTFVSCRAREPKPLVNGEVLVLATAENGVDQHQRLLEQPVVPEGHHPLPAEVVAAPVLQDRVSLGDVSPRAVERVRRAVAADEDLNRFAHYYAGRRIDELSRAGDNPHLRQKVDRDFTVAVRAEVVGFRGACYHEALIDVRFSVDGAEYAATLQAVPASGQVIERPTDERCERTGLRMPYGVLDRCVRTGRLVPKHRLFTSEVSGRRAIKEHVRRCGVTRKLVLDDEVATCAATGTVAIRDLLIECVRPPGLILRTEAGRSDVSGAVVWKNLLRPSAKPPHRRGVPDEFGRCEETGAELLVDELALSDASGKRVDRALLVRSEMSERKALARELVACGVTGKRGLPDETGLCTVSGLRVDTRLLVPSALSGKTALDRFMVTCAVTGKKVLPGELAQCAVTGKWVLPTLLVTCEESGVRALSTELGRCAVSGRRLLLKYLAVSDVSKKRVDRRLLTASALPPGRLGLEDEFAVCELTKRRLLKDEVVVSAVSGRAVGRDVLVRSDASGRWGARDEVVVCQETGAQLLSDEAVRCAETGRLADPRLLTTLQPSGRRVLTRLTAVCQQTGKQVLARELEECQLTKKKVLPTELETCVVSGTRALRSLLSRCAVSGRWLLPAYLAASDVSGKRVDCRLLTRSALSPGRRGLADEVVLCAVSGLRLLSDEVGTSAVSGRVVRRDLLIKSAASDRFALKDEMVLCEESGARLLPDEAARCTETGRSVNRQLLVDVGQPPRPVLKRLTGVSSLSNSRALLQDLETCALTHVVALRSELVRSDLSGRCAVQAHACRSPVSRKILLSDEGVRCQWSGARVFPKEAGRCDLTDLAVARIYLNHDGQLAPLADLLDGKHRELDRCFPLEESKSHLLRQLRSLDPVFENAIDGWALRSPDGRAAAAVLRVEVRGWFSQHIEFIGVVLRVGDNPRILGKGVQGRRSRTGEFVVSATLEFS
jgi:hypothetical protein